MHAAVLSQMFSDVWLLHLTGDTGSWEEIVVKNPEFSPPALWCHPACMVRSDFLIFFKVHFCPLQEIVAWVRHRSCKNISTDSYRCWYIFVCLNSSMAVGVWDYNMRTDVDACDCTWGLYGPCKRVCTESRLWEKNPLLHQGLKPTSVVCLGFQPAAVPTVAVAIILTPRHLSFSLYIYKSNQSIFSFLS